MSSGQPARSTELERVVQLAPEPRPWYNLIRMRLVRSPKSLFALSMVMLLTALELDHPRHHASAQVDPSAEDVIDDPADGAPEADADADAGELPEPSPRGPLRRLIVIDVATYGVDPVVGRVASERIRRTGAAMGYEVLSPEESVAAAQRLRMPYPPAPADLWRVTWMAQAHRGAFARIWAAGGRYVIEMSVASLDGTGPFFGRDTAGAEDLREVVDRLLQQTLPNPATWQEAPTRVVAAPTRAVRRPRPRDELAHPGGIGVRLPEPPLRRWKVTIQTEAVIGTTQGGFYNHLVGARLDFRVTRDLMFGAYFGYTNLQGRNDRAHNLLVMLQGEQRVRLSPALDLTIPLRVAVGYLPFNGPVIRLAAGVNYAISEDFEIGLDVIAPTFWVLPDDFAVSLDIALEASYRLP